MLKHISGCVAPEYHAGPCRDRSGQPLVMLLRVLDASGRPNKLLVPVLDLLEARLWVAQHAGEVSHADVVTFTEVGQLVCLQEYTPGLDWSPMRADCRGLEVLRD